MAPSSNATSSKVTVNSGLGRYFSTSLCLRQQQLRHQPRSSTIRGAGGRYNDNTLTRDTRAQPIYPREGSDSTEAFRSSGQKTEEQLQLMYIAKVRAKMKFGDWLCSGCNAHNYSSKDWCHKCHVVERPLSAGDNRPPSARGIPNKSSSSSSSKQEKEQNVSATSLYRSDDAKLSAPKRFVRAGDWVCNECQAHNFTTKKWCHLCAKTHRPTHDDDSRWVKDGQQLPIPVAHRAGGAPPDVLTTKGDFVNDGDWLCPECNGHNFNTRNVCLKCSYHVSHTTLIVSKKEGAPLKRYQRGDWVCHGCREHNYGRHEVCSTKGCSFKQSRQHREKFSVGSVALKMMSKERTHSSPQSDEEHSVNLPGFSQRPTNKVKASGHDGASKKGDEQHNTGREAAFGTLRGVEGVFMPGDWICLRQGKNGHTCRQHNIARHRNCANCNGRVGSAMRIGETTRIPIPPTTSSTPPQISIPTDLGFYTRDEITDFPPLPAQMTDLADDGTSRQVNKRVLRVGTKKQPFWLCTRCASYNAPSKRRCVGCAMDRPTYLDTATTALDEEDRAEKRMLDTELSEAKLAPAKRDKALREANDAAKEEDVSAEVGDGSGDDLHFAQTAATPTNPTNDQRLAHNKKLASLVDKVLMSREAMMNQWLCVQCHTINDVETKECNSCGFENPDPAPTPAQKKKAAMEEVRQLRKKLWEEKRIKMQEAHRVEIQKIKESFYKVPGAKTNERNLGGGSWLCMQCETVNKQHDVNCRGCTLIKPGYKSPKVIAAEEREKRVAVWMEAKAKRREALRSTPSHYTGLRTFAGQSWLCMECHTLNLNDQGSDECKGCALPKPKSPTPPPSVSSEDEGKIANDDVAEKREEIDDNDSGAEKPEKNADDENGGEDGSVKQESADDKSDEKK